MEEDSHVLTAAICKSQHCARSQHNPSSHFVSGGEDNVIELFWTRNLLSLRVCALTPVHIAFIVFVLIPALSSRRSRVLLFTVCSHLPFPISPSGKSQLFVQVPSVIEFAAEIACWKISFSLSEGMCASEWVCVALWAHSLLPNWSILSSISQFLCSLHFGLCTNRLFCPFSIPALLLCSAVAILLSTCNATQLCRKNWELRWN